MKKIFKKAVPKTVGALLNVSSLINSKYAAAKAMALFASPLKGRVLPHQQKFLNTAKNVELDYDGFSVMTYHWLEDGPTVLLCHGWESNAHRWKKLIKLLLEAHFNVIALDAPAHGNSESKRFNALIYAEFIHVVAKSYQPEIIIGHSVGGMASVIFQHKYKCKTLKKMVLLGAPSEFASILRNYIDLLGYNKKVVTSLEKLIFDTFGKKPSEFSTAKFAQSIENISALIIHDTEDAVIPFVDAELIHRYFKNSRLEKTTGHGHSLNHAEVYDLIMNFLTE